MARPCIHGDVCRAYIREKGVFCVARALSANTTFRRRNTQD